jgi:general secretion pathway protein D
LLVILDTSDDFSLGVELSAGDRTGLDRLLEFTSFGLSTVDPVSGSLALIPGRGYNFTLVDPEDANAIIRALAAHRRAKVTSAPRILVNDNATGTLASVTEVPFTSVNASNTVATTSFAGFAEAGTTIEVTPRITDDDHLEMDFSVSLNSFTGAGGAGVPPPRQTDQVTSSVTVPNAYTVVVGGLTRKNYSQMRDAVPFLEDFPILRDILGTQSKAQSQTTLFVFLKPVILRDDKFRDLKFLSDRDLPAATEPGNYPEPVPLLMGVCTSKGSVSYPARREPHTWTRPVNNNRFLPSRPFVRTGLFAWPTKQ